MEEPTSSTTATEPFPPLMEEHIEVPHNDTHHHHHHHRPHHVPRPSAERLAAASDTPTTTAPTSSEEEPTWTSQLLAPIRFAAFLVSLSWVDYRAQHTPEHAQWYSTTEEYSQCSEGKWGERRSSHSQRAAPVHVKVRKMMRVEVGDAFEQWGRVEVVIVALALGAVGAVSWALREAWGFVRR